MPTTTIKDALRGIKLGDSVAKALTLSLDYFDGEELSARDLLVGSLVTSRSTKSAAFKKIYDLISPAEPKPKRTTRKWDQSATVLDEPLRRSLEVAHPYLNTGLVWGRDLVTLILLTPNDKKLEEFLFSHGWSQAQLQGEWFRFLVDQDEHRTQNEWSAWWADAGFNIPGMLVSQNVVSQNVVTPKPERIVHDIFLSYSEKDELAVEPIYDQIKAWGFDVFFWGLNTKYGEHVSTRDSYAMQNAKLSLIFLGENSWGPTQLEQAKKIVEKEDRQFIPVLIGNVSDRERERAGKRFLDARYLDLTKDQRNGLEKLRQAIIAYGISPKNEPQAVSDSVFKSNDVNKILDFIINGTELQRIFTRREIGKSKTIDRTTLSIQLRNAINQTEAFSSGILWKKERTLTEIIETRKWLIVCLIWADPESIESKNIVLRYMELADDDSYTAELLAHSYRTKAPYLNDIVAMGLKRKTDSWTYTFSRTIQEPSDHENIQVLRSHLRTGTWDTKQQVLLILRAVPIKRLIPDIAEVFITGTGKLPIEALYTIRHTEIAPEAVNYLSDRLGDKFVERFCENLEKAEPYERRDLPQLLQHLNEKKVDEGLTSLSGTALQSTAAEIREYLSWYRAETKSIRELPTAGYKSDTIDVAHDLLEIKEDVKTLTAVILSKEVEPPLAIGLFADWGHGKSFFMESIKEEVKFIGTEARYTEDKFCKHTVQIDFNAWHYIDTNLWASLVSRILSKLAEHVSPEATFEERQKAFMAELESTKAMKKEAEDQQEVVQKEIEEKQKELQQWRTEREQKKIELRDLRPKDIYALLNEDPSSKKELKNTLEQMGIPSMVKSVSDLEDIIKQTSTTAGRTSALFSSLFQSKNAWFVVGIVVIVSVFPFVLKWFEGTTYFSWLAEDSTVLAAKVATIVTGLGAIIRTALGFVNKGISKIEEIRQKAETLAAQKMNNASPREKKLEAEIEVLNAKEEQGLLVVNTATQRVAEIQERLRLLNEERSLTHFLTERTKSDDYRRHLGLISTIQQDFTKLTATLASAHDPENNKFKKVDRIILYIDDLDRCPAQKVIEVLQAVHLLLAYKLFVVVVGVDPRWLLNSLGETYSAFENKMVKKDEGSDEAKEWLTTPQNFLEKIFQVQFSLRPMGRDGYKALVENLLSNQTKKKNSNGKQEETTANNQKDQKPIVFEDNKNDKKEDKKGSAEDTNEATTKTTVETKLEQPATETKVGVTEKTTATNGEQTPAPAIATNQARNTNTGQQASSANGSTSNGQFAIDDEALVIKPWEITFAKSLFDFIPSPRAAKRFSNVYRILKAAVPKRDLDRFEGLAGFPGDFQVPMVLLALVTGASTSAVKLFPDLQRRITGRTDDDFGGKVDPQEVSPAMAEIREAEKKDRPAEKIDQAYVALLDKLIVLFGKTSFPDERELFKYWIPRVSRFSFDLSRILTQRRNVEREEIGNL